MCMLIVKIWHQYVHTGKFIDISGVVVSLCWCILSIVEIMVWVDHRGSCYCFAQWRRCFCSCVLCIYSCIKHWWKLVPQWETGGRYRLHVHHYRGRGSQSHMCVWNRWGLYVTSWWKLDCWLHTICGLVIISYVVSCCSSGCNEGGINSWGTGDQNIFDNFFYKIYIII